MSPHAPPAEADLVARYAAPAARATAATHVVEYLRDSGVAADGAIRLEVLLPDGGVEAWTLAFDGPVVALDPSARPEVVLRLPLDALVHLVSGEADGALLHLAGTLHIDGDAELVLGLGSSLRVPGAANALIDPAALDPVAVSAAIADASTEHLAGVMAGTFRDLVLGEVFRRLPAFLISEKAAKVAVTIAFEVGGRDDGHVDRYVVRVAGGVCTVQADAPADTVVDATLLLEGHEFLRLVLGHLNPVRGVLSGQVRVQGSVVKALGFNAVMRIPGS
ncbi:MAG TPA: SCP2 sterol-binding domain-containing protein [Marmoricola sp.]|jgi:putative sterol carrier protein|nr:SCP2 sterol-binding domain-containing protein [Marmoricola sp.]